MIRSVDLTICGTLVDCEFGSNWRSAGDPQLRCRGTKDRRRDSAEVRRALECASAEARSVVEGAGAEVQSSAEELSAVVCRAQDRSYADLRSQGTEELRTSAGYYW